MNREKLLEYLKVDYKNVGEFEELTNDLKEQLKTEVETKRVPWTVFVEYSNGVLDWIEPETIHEGDMSVDIRENTDGDATEEIITAITEFTLENLEEAYAFAKFDDGYALITYENSYEDDVDVLSAFIFGYEAPKNG